MVVMLALLSTGLSLSLSRADLAAVVIAEPRLLCAKADTIAASARLGHPPTADVTKAHGAELSSEREITCVTSKSASSLPLDAVSLATERVSRSRSRQRRSLPLRATAVASRSELAPPPQPPPLARAPPLPLLLLLLSRWLRCQRGPLPLRPGQRSLSFAFPLLWPEVEEEEDEEEEEEEVVVVVEEEETEEAIPCFLFLPCVLAAAMGCAVSKGAAVPSLAYEVTTTTSLSSVLAASAYSILRSASMGAAVVRLNAYEDDGGDDGKKKAVAAARGGGECLSVVVGGGVQLRNIHRCLLFLVSWAVDASTSLGGGKAKTEARARARVKPGCGGRGALLGTSTKTLAPQRTRLASSQPRVASFSPKNTLLELTSRTFFWWAWLQTWQ
ncbi:hypothetical protein OsI_29550 [Oryza sativa Indica Group]|uniref:Uncharacterized protein n=1 Tax=Oryza sativa subsp. indica TaxID=39946 RepID=B8BBK5_ORYSI|nr:hypothetical protein OsI_29550 [Oryza sativa Indica Group]